jgi:alkylation response protein AidB-like acyl-CoA dehydrogenase
LIGALGGGKELAEGFFTGTAPIVGVFAAGLLRAAFEFALHFARTEHGGGGVPIIEHQAVGYALADAKKGIEAVRARNWRPRFPTVLEFSSSRPARILRVSHAPLAM